MIVVRKNLSHFRGVRDRARKLHVPIARNVGHFISYVVLCDEMREARFIVP